MNKKLLSIVAVICAILALLAGKALWSSLNIAHHLHMIGMNNRHIYAEMDVRSAVNRQLTAGMDYLSSGDRRHKNDFNEYGAGAVKAFEKWTTLLKGSGKKELRDRQQKLDRAERLRRQYSDVIKIITGAFKLPEKGRKGEAVSVAEEKVHLWIDDILLPAFDKAAVHDVQNNSMCYNALLSRIGSIPWSTRKSIKQVEIAQSGMRYFLALDTVRSHIVRQLDDAGEHLSSGDGHTKRDFEIHTLSVTMYLVTAFNAVEAQNDIGFEGARENFKQVSGIEHKYNSIIKLYETAFKLRAAGRPSKLVEEKIEALEGDELFPSIDMAIENSKKQIDLAHKQLKNHTFTAGVQSFVSMGIISLIIVFLTVKLIRGMMVSLKKLNAGAELIGSGRLDHRIDINSRDELRLLAHSFNKMAGDLQKTTVSREQYQRQNEFFHHIIESISHPFYVLDANDYTIIMANSATGRAEEWRNKTCHFYTHRSDKPCDSKDHECPLKLVKESGRAVVVEHQHYDKDGTLKYYEVHGHPVINDSGDVVQMIEYSIDITERKAAINRLKESSEKLRQSNIEMNRFVHIASHDLQEPLRKVAVFGDLLKTKYADLLGNQGQDYIRRIQRAIERMQTLITDLLFFSRIMTRAQPYSSVDLSAVLRGVLSDFELYLEQLKGRVEVSGLPAIEADPLQMRQLFQNLIDNALKFHKPDGPPVVKIYSAPVKNDGRYPIMPASDVDFYEITIEDNGIGFDEQYSERIFGVFQRLHSRNEYEGNGIGLAVCKKIVERHGGTIEAKGRQGEGSTFIITLPVKQSTEVICNVG